MQRSYVAAILLAACGFFVSSCDLIFGKAKSTEIKHSFTGNWKCTSDSTLSDSIFSQPISDSTGTIQLTFEADSTLTVKKADSAFLHLYYNQNKAGDTLYIKQDSLLTMYPVIWNSDSSVSLSNADKTYKLFRQ